MNPADYRATFAERGRAYDDAMTAEPHARDEEFAFVLGVTDLRTPCRLLDAPAGGGYLADRLPPGVDYVALESAPSFAARCRSRGVAVIEDDLAMNRLRPVLRHHRFPQQSVYAVYPHSTQPSPKVRRTLGRITDLNVLETLLLSVVKVDSWTELLADLK